MFHVKRVGHRTEEMVLLDKAVPFWLGVWQCIVIVEEVKVSVKMGEMSRMFFPVSIAWQWMHWSMHRCVHRWNQCTGVCTGGCTGITSALVHMVHWWYQCTGYTSAPASASRQCTGFTSAPTSAIASASCNSLSLFAVIMSFENVVHKFVRDLQRLQLRPVQDLHRKRVCRGVRRRSLLYR